MPLIIERNDITKLHTDAVVNAANSNLAPGGGVCGAIFEAAGFDELFDECRKIGHCDVGCSVITPGFSVAKYIIHTVGPVWRGGNHNEEHFLRESYRSAMQLALDNDCESIAFPLISSGIYGYPKKQAFEVAVDEIKSFVLAHDITVILCVFGKEATRLSEKLFKDINQYIDDNYETEYLKNERRRERATVLDSQEKEQNKAERYLASLCGKKAGKAAASDVIPEAASPVCAGNDFETEPYFGLQLMQLIDAKGLKDSDVYKAANINRKHFSKLKKQDYNPGKYTVLALAVGLRLSLEETRELLACAGYALSHSKRADLIVEYFIRNGNYDIFEINRVLFDYNEKLLGA